MKKIIYADRDGRVCVLTANPAGRLAGESEDAFLTRIAAKDIPAGAIGIQFVDADAIPKDRSARNEWKIEDFQGLGDVRRVG